MCRFLAPHRKRTNVTHTIMFGKAASWTTFLRSWDYQTPITRHLGHTHVKTKQSKSLGETRRNMHMLKKHEIDNRKFIKKKHHVKNEWESHHKNASYVADNALQTKHVKIKLMFTILLVAIKSLVRRTMGIVAPATRCILQKNHVTNKRFEIVLSLKE